MPFRKHFDIPDGITYINTPGNGLLPRSNYAWRAEREKNFFEVSGKLRDEQPAFIEEVRETIAKTFHADVKSTFCTPNFSFGFNVLIDRLPTSYKYLLLNEDYPSLNYPIISRGLEYQTIDIDEQLESNIRRAVKVFQPDVLLLSIIQYINGVKIDLDFISELKSEFPTLLIIGDGTQFLGTEPFDFQASGFDAVGASGYKWLMSGFGNGFLLLSDMLTDRLNSTLFSRPLPKEPMWQSKTILRTFFEPGHQDTLSHGTLAQSLQFLQQLGLENIQKHIASLTEYAYHELRQRNLLLPLVADRTVKSQLINIQISASYYETLLAQGVRCFPRGSGIRIGLHLYNNEADITHLMTIIDAFKQ